MKRPSNLDLFLNVILIFKKFQDKIKSILVKENGKTSDDAAGDILRGLRKLK